MSMTGSAAAAANERLPYALALGIVRDWKRPVVVLDDKLCIAFANLAFCNWVRVAWREVDHRPVEDFLQCPQIKALLYGARLGSGSRDFRITCSLPHSRERILDCSVNWISSEHATSLVVDDVTELELGRNSATFELQTALRKEDYQRDQANLLRSIMESSGDGIAVLNGRGFAVLWNPACEKMLGLKAGIIRYDLWPKHFGFYLPDQKNLVPAGELPLARALRGESSDNVEIFVKNEARPEGLWISMTARPLTGGQNGAVATFRDITFAKQAAEALAAKAEEVSRSNRELEQFAYVASHDLQEPLRMVSSYVQLLARRYRGKLDSDAEEFIGYATDGAKRMSQLIDDLLGYSRVGRGSAVEVDVDCERALETAVSILQEKIHSSEARITHDPLPRIRANEAQIVQLFQNLIDNALKFRSLETPRVHISAQPGDSQWIFSVADNGIGIAPEYRDRVFVIFQRLHNREAYPGTGIGLAICKKIVEQHSGLIWIAPQEKGGTTIMFSWPNRKSEEKKRNVYD